ncbi:glycosyltransferase [Rhizobium sp. G187]|uniref:glycosyltransferase n=1 Tax=Rhizobium sp. G187 TaxID=3451352 RepID=UPI003EE71B34
MLSVVIVTRNESLAIRDVLASVVSTLSSIPCTSAGRHEIVLVDDSDDLSTIDAARQALMGEKRIDLNLVHRSPGERDGLTGAILFGLRVSANARVVVMDGDGQHPTDMLVNLAQQLSSSSVVFASRYIHINGDAGLSHAIRRVASRTINRFLIGTLGKYICCTDPLSGFFAVDKSAVTLPSTSHGGWKAGFLILTHNLADRRAELKYSEVGFSIAPRLAGESKLSLRTSFRILWELRCAARMLA